MRLEKIKLAGFKSFVDPTTVPIPSNLVGIVGPNGCGKSNVIDAVRLSERSKRIEHLIGRLPRTDLVDGQQPRDARHQVGRDPQQIAERSVA